MVRAIRWLASVRATAVIALASCPSAADDPPTALVEDARRIAAALIERAAPLPVGVRDVIARGRAGVDDDRVMAALDRHALLDVTVSPEGRVKVARGPAELGLVRDRPGYALVKVTNQSHATPRLRTRVEFAGGGESPFGIELIPLAGVGPELTGRPVEYRLLAVTSREAGRWEITVGFDAGQGTQDLGFRGEVPVLVTVRAGPPDSRR